MPEMRRAASPVLTAIVVGVVAAGVMMDLEFDSYTLENTGKSGEFRVEVLVLYREHFGAHDSNWRRKPVETRDLNDLAPSQHGPVQLNSRYGT